MILRLDHVLSFSGQQKSEVYTSQIILTKHDNECVCNRFTEEFTDIFRRCIPCLVDQRPAEPGQMVSDVQYFSYLVSGKMSKYSIV